MTTDLIIQNWENKPIRFIKEDLQTFVPVVDIAGAIGVDKRSCLRLLDRNSALFSSYERGVHLTTPGGMQYTRCLNRDGTLGFLFKLSTNHVKDSAIREKLVEFQKWAIDKLSQSETLHPALLSSPEGPDFDLIIKKLQFVRKVHEETGWDLFALQKEVLTDAKLAHLVYHIEPAKPALPPVQKPKDYLTATDIGERIGKTAHEVNMFLYQHKPALLIRDKEDGFRITLYGKEFGEERYEQFLSGHFGWYTVWKRDVLRLFNVHEHEEMG